MNYTYDGGNRLTKAVDSISGTITRGFDGLDRLTSDATPQGAVSYTYDNAGRRATLTVPGQSVVNYTFDNAYRLTQIVQGSTTVQFGYDVDNRRTTLTLPNGIVVSYNYDNGSQLSGMTYSLGTATLGNLSYSYDTLGHRSSMGGSFARTGLPLAVTTTAYNANNQLTTWGTANLFYDLNGNMTSDGTHAYAWDARNHLKQIDLGSTASFTYDPFGRRTSKGILGTTTNFLYDGVNAVQEVIGSNTANSLGGAIDEVFQRTDSAGARSILTDALGSTVALADSTGTLQTQYTFEPFGNTSQTGSATTNSFAYTGREADLGNLYYSRARYYSPALQRFISEDPLGLSGGDANVYQYVFSNPTNITDAFGLSGLLFCRVSGHLFLIPEEGNIPVGVFPAGNNASSDSEGPFPDGVFPILGHNYHPPDPNGPFGSNGIFVFDVPGMAPGMGVHSGRRDKPDKRGRVGPQHATKGCIRTTDEAMKAITDLDQTDPLQRIVVDDCSY